jgi:LysM repeat protein
MHEIRGYFIYYDKNKNMHEYMLHDRATDHVPTPSAYVEVFGEREEEPELPSRTEELLKKREAGRGKHSAASQRRSLNLVAGLSAVLFIICFVMGAGLIQNRDLIAEMQTQIAQLNTAYRNLFVQLASDGTSPVFAAQQDTDTPGQPTYTPPPATVSPVQAETAAPTQPPTDAPFITEPPQTAEPVTESVPTEAPAAPVTPEPVTQEPGASIPAEVVVTEPVQAAVPEAYTIQPGDSLLNISLEFYGTTGKVNEILALNGISDADMIIAGRTIALPRP